MKTRAIIYRLILVAVLGAAIVWLALHREYFQADRLERELHRFGRWAPILFILSYTLATVLFAPGSAFSLAGGALFGPVWGTLWNLAGATLGAGLAFLTARYLASDWVAKKSGERLERLMRGVEAEGWRFVAFVRLAPLFPFNLLNYALGLTRIGFGTYLLTSTVCMLPGAFAYTWLGYAGRQAAAGGESTMRDVLIALTVLASVAVLPRLVGRFRKPPCFIEGGELNERLEHARQTVVIDVRTAKEFNGPLGHILDARNIALQELSANVQAIREKKNAPIVLVCKTNKRSAKAAELLCEAGFE